MNMAQTEWHLFRAIRTDSTDFTKLDGIVAGEHDASSDGLMHARTGGDVSPGPNRGQIIEAPDVVLERADDSQPWYVQKDGGTSTHDVPGWFGYSNWCYFYLPQGTEYCDDTLFIKRDRKKKWNRRKSVKGRHYTVRPKNRMRLQEYFGALDSLARAAIVKAVADGKSVRVSTADEAASYQDD